MLGAAGVHLGRALLAGLLLTGPIAFVGGTGVLASGQASAATAIVATYTTAFAHKAAVETVTATYEKDGSWRVSGYFIK